MNTDRRRRRGEEGFTLIEVMVAMVILAIGLLGLEALGIGAARSIALAEDRSDYTMLAMRRMETQIQAIRSNPSANANSSGSWTRDADTGLWFRVVSTTGSPTPPDVAHVTVQIRVSEASTTDAFVISSFVYDGAITSN